MSMHGSVGRWHWGFVTLARSDLRFPCHCLAWSNHLCACVAHTLVHGCCVFMVLNYSTSPLQDQIHVRHFLEITHWEFLTESSPHASSCLRFQGSQSVFRVRHFLDITGWEFITKPSHHAASGLSFMCSRSIFFLHSACGLPII
jgi:hypothetical protein